MSNKHMSKQETATPTRVYLRKVSVTSGRGGMPSIGYACELVDCSSSVTLAKTRTVDGVHEHAWRDAGEQLAKRRGYVVVSPEGTARARQKIALTEALKLAITAPTEEQSKRATAEAVGLAVGLADAEVHACKMDAKREADAEQRGPLQLTITVEINDADLIEMATEERRRFAHRLQNALDKEWPYARMESIRVVGIADGPAPLPPVVTRPCEGCDAPIEYRLDDYPRGTPHYSPSVNGGASSAYRSGHLCYACDLAVGDALRNRTTEGK